MRFFGLIIALCTGVTGLAARTCESLTDLQLSATTILSAEVLKPGSFTPPQGKEIQNLPEVCRVAGVIKPTEESEIRFEVWMPVSGWNGKFLGVGNGGFAGSIDYTGLGNAVRESYASAGTDTGHRGGGTDASWAFGKREKTIDFGYRAIHETADRAKAIVASFLGDRPKWSFFASCSNGGRQALMEAQRYPSDYDGILAGAPAFEFTKLMLEFVSNTQALNSTPESRISAAKLPAIERAVLAQCDAKDGLADGLVDQPGRCSFDPSALLCKGTESDSCLTPPQVAALSHIYTGLSSDVRTRFTAGFSPGGETGPLGWGRWILGMGSNDSIQRQFGTSFLRNMVFAKPDYQLNNFDYESALAATHEKLAPIIDATSLDLKPFANRKGKLIIYHGWSDAAVPPESSIRYFDAVRSAMTGTDVDSFLRLYMVPGMQHCRGGPGPNDFGATLNGKHDPHSMFAVLERWTVEGTKPGPIAARKFVNDDPGKGLLRSRPLCPYPQVAKYLGKGSVDEAASFVCKAP